MEFPILIEPLPDGCGYIARLSEPVAMHAEGPTREEARDRLMLQVQQRPASGSVLAAGKVSLIPTAGIYPDDEVTRDWLEQIRQLRDERDAADRKRLADEGSPVRGSS